MAPTTGHRTIVSLWIAIDALAFGADSLAIMLMLMLVSLQTFLAEIV